jgi:hypothetical protein
MLALQKNLRIKNRQSFTASLMEGKNSRFIAINHTEVCARGLFAI